jgi:multiple sugar transport system substrate-binding protein
LAIAAMLTLVGCGRDSTGGGDTARPIGERRASGEITVWAMGSEGEKLSVLAQDFMKVNPDAKVTVTPIPWDGAHDKIATAIAG